MKKWLVFVIAVVILAVIATAIGIGHSEKMNIKRAETFMIELANNTFCEYVGIINATQINGETGSVYNGPAIYKRVCEQAGLKDADTSTIFLMEIHGVSVYLMTVYEPGQDNTPLLQRVVWMRYIYGLI